MADTLSSVQEAYDAVAREYDRQISNELDGKPLDRAWLRAFWTWWGPPPSPTWGADQDT